MIRQQKRSISLAKINGEHTNEQSTETGAGARLYISALGLIDSWST